MLYNNLKLKKIQYSRLHNIKDASAKANYLRRRQDGTGVSLSDSTSTPLDALMELRLLQRENDPGILPFPPSNWKNVFVKLRKDQF